MAARRKRSRKPSAGSAHSLSPSPPDDFVVYLDENLCYTRAILDVLTKLGIRFERHLTHFSPGTLDEAWLPLVGSKGWILLTSDKRIRYNSLEKLALELHAVREFVFTSGNMSGQDMADALQRALNKMRTFCARTKPPFVASITRTGEVNLRWPKS
jgi:PIN domain-containing protein